MEIEGITIILVIASLFNEISNFIEIYITGNTVFLLMGQHALIYS